MKWYHYVVVGLIMVGVGCSQNPKPQTWACQVGGVCVMDHENLKVTMYGDGGTDITVFSGSCPSLTPAAILTYLKDLDKYLPYKDTILVYHEDLFYTYSTRGNQLRADAARLDQEDKAVSDYRFILGCIQQEAQK